MAMQSTTLQNLQSCLDKLEEVCNGFDHQRRVTLNAGFFSKLALIKVYHDPVMGTYEVVVSKGGNNESEGPKKGKFHVRTYVEKYTLGM